MIITKQIDYHMKRFNIIIKNRFRAQLPVVLACLILFGYTSCEDPNSGKHYATSEKPMIDEYLAGEDEDLSDFSAIIETVGLQGTLHAYGTYTCFAPTNAAIKKWCTEKYGKNSWKDLSTAVLDSMVRFHLVNDTISTSDFVDGRLSTQNGLKKYITTATKLNSNNETYIEINRQAEIVEKDIHAENGIIQKIDAVLTPSPNSVYQAIKSEFPANDYKIFIAALEQSGYDKVLNDVSSDTTWYTLLVEPDAVFRGAGINSVDDLIDSLAVIRKDVTLRGNLLKMFIQYHIIPSLAYMADMMRVSTIETLKDGEVISLYTSKLDVLLNRFPAFGEMGVPIDRSVDYTDFSCRNGVIHTLSGFLPPKLREATPVYWDIAEQPELTALKEFRQDGTSITFHEGELSEMKFEAASSSKGITYSCSKTYGEKFQYVNYDNMYFGVNPDEIVWIEMKLPLLIAGTYKVWVCWRRVDYPMTFRTTFKQEGYDDQVFPNVFSTYDYMPTNQTISQLLNNGWKYYIAKAPKSNGGKVFVSRLLGTITVYKTGRHILRFEGLSGSNKVYWDMIHFIPATQNQLWPRFDVGGNEIYESTECKAILPYDQSCDN
jgi:uncharacterized surface protein with fasciclin (FAS1) repeats